MALVTDATLLGVKLDGVLLVVRLGITSRDAAKKTRELLTTSRAEVLGVVINDITRRHGHDYYYYYYYGDNENEHD
jgi:Mrp family chromosome partitioning ATPase